MKSVFSSMFLFFNPDDSIDCLVDLNVFHIGCNGDEFVHGENSKQRQKVNDDNYKYKNGWDSFNIDEKDFKRIKRVISFYLINLLSLIMSI
jgi:hypothetical protein